MRLNRSVSFTPITTERLVIRPVTGDDVWPLLARRNDPMAGLYQRWELPFALDRAEELTADASAMDGPADGEWWMAAVDLKSTGVVVGDVAVRLSWGGRCAEIGYTLASQHWGNGYSTEAAAAMVDYLFSDPRVTRVSGTVHPENTASARVLERIGMLYEGHTRNSFWVGEINSDDWIYGMTREDWETWRDRIRIPPREVTFVPVDHSNERSVCKLKTHWTQREFVASMERSFTDALFPEIVDGAPVVPWMRAVQADGELVGFVMLALVTDAHPEPYLWRLLIDRLHQRRGIGKRALDLVVEECRSMGASTVLTSWNPDPGTPEAFYVAYGFEPTGKIVDEEVEARLKL